MSIVAMFLEFLFDFAPTLLMREREERISITLSATATARQAAMMMIAFMMSEYL
jgi:hypothetical protein